MIKIINGSLTDSKADVIGHQCNCKGVMGKGVALCIKNTFPKAFVDYRKDFMEGKLKLGYVGFSKIGDNRYIANICGQEDYYTYYNNRTNYTDYNALSEGLNKVKNFMEDKGLKTIAFPYMMSCGLAGGDWKTVYSIINEIFEDFDVELWKL